MNRIASTLQQFQKNKRTIVIPYITPEFPIKGTTIPLILALEQSGAGMIEIGIPFSDPLADGPTIQHSSEIAIKNGATLKRVLELITEARKQTTIPLILMGYINPILNYGVEKFLLDAKKAGVDGLIIPDMPPEESDEFRSLCVKNDLSNIFLIAPTSSEERIRYIDSLSTDFSYCVSVTGVTGARASFGDHFDEYLSRVKKNTTKAFVVGFGIKSKEQIVHITAFSDGVVVASALLQAIAEKKNIDDVVATARQFFSSLV
ncbi:MAG: tryptophan synthase subunit alpha [Bacteroidota bacterium]|nr:tryptophan synthase subunit alpha [Bacteroidota bacterium]